MERYSKEFKKIFGKRLRRLRRERGMTQEELGEKSGISYKFIGEIERGEANPSLISLLNVSESLGVDFQELFNFEKDKTHYQETRPESNEVFTVRESIARLLTRAEPKTNRLALKLVKSLVSEERERKNSK